MEAEINEFVATASLVFTVTGGRHQMELVIYGYMGFLCIGLVLVISSLIHWFSNLVKRKKKKIATKPRNQHEKKRKKRTQAQKPNEKEWKKRKKLQPNPKTNVKRKEKKKKKKKMRIEKGVSQTQHERPKKKKKDNVCGESKKSNRGSLNVCVFTKMPS